MKNKICISLLFVLILLCTATCAFAVQGTDGDELQVVEAQKLEIQLGPQWAGVEFVLKTDAGIYPDIIPVDEYGILSLEIGGSSTYTLSCLDSGVPIPKLTDTQASVTSEIEHEKEDLVPIKEVEHKPTIPTSHIIIFAVGIVIAIGVLVGIYVSNKKRRIVQNDEDDEDFE